MSEEQFAASLIHGASGRAQDSDAYPAHRPPLETFPAPLEEQWGLVAATAPVAAPQAATVPQPEWKREVSSRLEKYRARRGGRRPRHQGSLSLDFERAVNRMTAEDVVSAPSAVVSSEAVAPAFGDSHSVPEVQPENNVIEFPRIPAVFEPIIMPTGHELAEPVIDRPRILEVPEEVHTSQAPLADIQLAPENTDQQPEAEPLLLRVAPVGRRVLAALIDSATIAVATAMFTAIVMRGDVTPPQGKAAVALLLALPCALSAIYEYLFLVYAGHTPGMRWSRLAIVTFDGEAPDRQTRRTRALATMLSSLSLGLGLLWALVDEDELCWHDRISRTHLMHY